MSLTLFPSNSIFMFFGVQAFNFILFERGELVLCGSEGSFQNQKTLHSKPEDASQCLKEVTNKCL